MAPIFLTFLNLCVFAPLRETLLLIIGAKMRQGSENQNMDDSRKWKCRLMPSFFQANTRKPIALASIGGIKNGVRRIFDFLEVRPPNKGN